MKTQCGLDVNQHCDIDHVDNVNKIYCKRVIFGVYDIWRKLVFEQVGVDLNQRIPECDYSYTYMHCI